MLTGSNIINLQSGRVSQNEIKDSYNILQIILIFDSVKRNLCDQILLTKIYALQNAVCYEHGLEHYPGTFLSTIALESLDSVGAQVQIIVPTSMLT